MFQKVRERAVGLINIIKWKKDSLRHKKVTIAENNTTIPKEKIMIIAPHADDELIGCFSLINKYSPLILCCSLTGSNNEKENKTTRECEFTQFCHRMNVTGVLIKEDLKDEMASVISRYNPSMVILPSYVDWHREHRLVNETLCELLTERNTEVIVGWYQVSVPISTEAINHIERISRKEFREKWKVFGEVYLSQKGINIERYKFYNKDQCEGMLGEVFSLMEAESYIKRVEELKGNTIILDDLKKRINDVGYMYQVTSDIYERGGCKIDCVNSKKMIE